MKLIEKLFCSKSNTGADELAVAEELRSRIEPNAKMRLAFFLLRSGINLTPSEESMLLDEFTQTERNMAELIIFARKWIH